MGFSSRCRLSLPGLGVSLVLGTILGVFSTTRSRVLRGISRVYVEFYQNTPLPVQVFFMYMAGPQLLQAILRYGRSPVRTSAFMPGHPGSRSLPCGLRFRGYPYGYRDRCRAARSRRRFRRALAPVQAYRLRRLPQTFKVILPPLCNQALNFVKNTSVLALIAGGDLMYNADDFVSTYGYLQGYIMACVMYFIICFPLAMLVQWLERAPSVARAPRSSPA